MRRKRLTRIIRPWWLPLLTRRGLPLTYNSGHDRGTPIDRRYIEAFLDEHRTHIRGVCLEVESDVYVRRYGADVTRCDILDINPTNPHATMIGDLRCLPVSDDTYDCAVITQTLHLIPDPQRALAELRRVVKPGGAVLVTLPCVVKLWGPDPATDYWRFTPASAAWLFNGWDVSMSVFGNALTGAGFYLGMAQEDLPRRAWGTNDPLFPVVIGVTGRR